MEKIALVVTTISKPNDVLKSLAQGCISHGWDFVIAGDISSPKEFVLPGSDYYSLDRQMATDFSCAKTCLTKHYARKNVGYLIAIEKGAKIIVETDDDNFPEQGFWQVRQKVRNADVLQHTGWVNIYKHFSDQNIWPRGLPLPYIHFFPVQHKAVFAARHCPIQQGLANKNPDVDAIYRLVLPLPFDFKGGCDIALGMEAWTPFNSQNTTWWPAAFPLLYLPSYCSFRMTDIWRSLVAQRIAWANGWSVLFHNPTVYQERNVHNLMKDFTDEISGYLQTENIQKILSSIEIKGGVEHIPDAMRSAYGHLVENKIIDAKEMEALESWLQDINRLMK